MKTLSFTVPISKTEKSQAPGIIKAMRGALAAIPEAKEKLSGIVKLKEKVDARVVALERGDGTDDKAVADLSAAIIQQKQLERTLERTETAYDAAVKAFHDEICTASHFISDCAKEYLLDALKKVWDEAISAFYGAGKQGGWQNIEYIYNSSPAHNALGLFIKDLLYAPYDLEEMEITMETKISLINTLTEGRIFWSFKADECAAKAERVRNIHPLQQRMASGEFHIKDALVSTAQPLEAI